MTASNPTLEILRAALARIDDSDEQKRLEVYQAAFNAAERLPDASRDRYKDQLGKAILNIENEYGTFRGDNELDGEFGGVAEPLTPSAHAGPMEGAAEPVVDIERDDALRHNGHAPDWGDDDPAHVTSLDETDRLSDRQPQSGSISATGGGRSKRKRILVMAGLGLLALAILAGWGAWKAFQPGSQTVRADGVDARQGEARDLLSVLDHTFPKDIDRWRPGFRIETFGTQAYADFITGEDLLAAPGLRLVHGDHIAVDTDTIYLMKVDFVLRAPDEEMPAMKIGFATYDAQKKLQTDRPGTHRYFVLDGRVVPPAGGKAGDIFSVSGIISGTGNESHNTFRAGSAFIKPLVLVGEEEAGTGLAIRQISVRKVTE